MAVIMQASNIKEARGNLGSSMLSTSGSSVYEVEANVSSDTVRTDISSSSGFLSSLLVLRNGSASAVWRFVSVR